VPLSSLLVGPSLIFCEQLKPTGMSRLRAAAEVRQGLPCVWQINVCCAVIIFEGISAPESEGWRTWCRQTRCGLLAVWTPC